MVDYPIQSDINESCVGGEVFLTDFNIPPYYFNIQDLIDNYNNNSTTYFTSFNPLIYTINLEKQNDQPVFEGYSNGNGLDFGYYVYALQYVDSAGNRSSVGTFTPMIPVISNYTTSLNNTNVPNHLTRGSSNNFLKKYGINLRYRITNTGNYAFVNIIRVKWNAEAPANTVPSAQFFTVPYTLSNEETSTQYFTDNTTVIWSELPPADETQVLSVVQAAKGIRYYDNRIVLMNIKYASKDLTSTNIDIPVINDEKMFPYIHNMGVRGHSIPRNTTYYRGHRAGERSGFAVLCKDYNGEDAFAFPIEDIGGDVTYLFPNNRERLSQNSLDVSVVNGQGAVWSATINSHNNDDQYYTNEIINLEARSTLVAKPQLPAYSAKQKMPLTSTIGVHWDVSFNPIHPVHQDDITIQGHQETVVDKLFLNSLLNQSVNIPSGHIFAPELYSKGLGITGITGLPAWIKSFSIVKTEPVKRIIAQGIGTYAFTSLNNSDKQLYKIWFSSKEIDELNINILEATKLQFISPLGFHSEIYNAFNDEPDIGIGSGSIHGIDMMCYARIGHNKAGSDHTNYLLERAGGVLDYYTEFGSWRNLQPEANNPFYDGTQVNGNKKFTISTSTPPVLITPTNSRYSYWEITVNEPIYQNPTAPAGGHVNDAIVQAYHEPFYLVNLINDEAELPQNNVTTYYKTGHHQKIESIIGTGTGSSQTIQLCDERYDDCIPSEYSGDINTGIDQRPLIDTFIWIKNKIDGTEKRWLNITHKTTAIKNTIISDLNSQGYYDIPIATYFPNPYFELSDIRIYGVYTSDWNMLSDKDGKDAKIIFNNISDSSGVPLLSDYCLPLVDNYIVIKYDYRFPLKVFGGDTIISEDTACFIDGKTDSNGNGGVSVGELYLQTAFPYFGVSFNNAQYKRLKKATAHYLNGAIQQKDDYGIEYVRQLCVNFFHETKIHMPYEYNDVTSNQGWYYHNSRNFPHTHYIMRPEKWKDSGLKSENFSSNSGAINDFY
ncbi:MAG: hypothetical protein M1365_16685, partial [Actinobacteria bacterium]|nr:hypothetical protein [Actinomycetota bacterium]